MTSRHEFARTESGAATTIDTRRREVSQEQGALSEDYNATGASRQGKPESQREQSSVGHRWRTD
jgi:hypothetical protein